LVPASEILERTPFSEDAAALQDDVLAPGERNQPGLLGKGGKQNSNAFGPSASSGVFDKPKGKNSTTGLHVKKVSKVLRDSPDDDSENPLSGSTAEPSAGGWGMKKSKSKASW
jgi:hypothetical protein